MEYLLTNLSQPRYRKATFNGEEHVVVPLRMIVPGVLSGSKGPLYYPSDEIARNYKQWDGIPVTKFHPTDSSGNALSAKFPGVLGRQGMGLIRNPRVDNKGLRAEAWLNVNKTKKIAPEVLNAVMRNQPVEISTGLFTDNEPAQNGSNFRGRGYSHVARNYRADHLAILPGQVGACSVNDGCGLLMNESIMLGSGTTVNGGPGSGPHKNAVAKAHVEHPVGSVRTGIHVHGGNKPDEKITGVVLSHKENFAYPDKVISILKVKGQGKVMVGSHTLTNNQENQQQQLFNRFKQFLTLTGNETIFDRNASKELLENCGGEGGTPGPCAGSNLGSVGSPVPKGVSVHVSKTATQSNADGLVPHMHRGKEGTVVEHNPELGSVKVKLSGGGIVRLKHEHVVLNSNMEDFMECEQDCDDEDCIDDCLDELGMNEQVDNGGPGSGPKKGTGKLEEGVKHSNAAFSLTDKLFSSSSKKSGKNHIYTSASKAAEHASMGSHGLASFHHNDAAIGHRNARRWADEEGSAKHLEAAKAHEAAAKWHNANRETTNQDKDQTTGKFLHLGAGNGKGPAHEAAKVGHATLHGDIVTPDPEEEEIMDADTESVNNGGPGSGPHPGGGSYEHKYSISEHARSMGNKADKEGTHQAHFEAFKAHNEAAAQFTKTKLSSPENFMHDLHTEAASRHFNTAYALHKKSTNNGRSGQFPVRNKGGQTMAKLSVEDRETIIGNLCTNCSCQKANVFNEGDEELLENMSDDKLVALATQRDELAANEMVVNSVRKKFKISDKITLNAMPAALAKAQQERQGGQEGEEPEEGSQEEEQQESPEEEREEQMRMPARNQFNAEDRATLNWAKAERQRQKEAIIEQMTVNLGNDDESEETLNELSRMPLEQLQKISRLAPRKAQRQVQNTQAGPYPPQAVFGLGRQNQTFGRRPALFAGAAAPANNQQVNNADDDILEIPVTNWAELSPLNKKNNGSN